MSGLEELKARAAQGDPEGLFLLGLECVKIGDLCNAVRLWGEAAKMGHREAGFHLAQIGPEAALDTAVRRLHELSGDSDPSMLRAKVELGFLYCNVNKVMWASDKGWKLLDEVTQSVDIKNLPPFIIGDFADVFFRGIPSGGGVDNPSVDDLIKAVMYFSLAIEGAKADGGQDIVPVAEIWSQAVETCVKRLILRPKFEAVRKDIDMGKTAEQMTDELIEKHGLENAMEHIREKKLEAQEDIIEELRKHGLDNIVNKLERAWKSDEWENEG